MCPVAISTQFLCLNHNARNEAKSMKMLVFWVTMSFVLLYGYKSYVNIKIAVCIYRMVIVRTRCPENENKHYSETVVPVLQAARCPIVVFSSTHL